MTSHIMFIPGGNHASGPRHHYLPASVIGRFGPGSVLTPARERKVWVLRRNRTICQQAAATVAYQNNLYATGERDWNVDGMWAHYEQNANPAIDMLLAQFPGPFSVETWAHVATYIAANFARSPEFPVCLSQRFGRKREDGLDDVFTKENANSVRFLEYFRVSAAVARARWTILHSPTHPLILNDRGATAMYEQRHRTPGYAIPPRPSFAAVLELGPHDKPIFWHRSAWHIALPTATLTASQAEDLNTATWRQCRREVYASHYDELHRLQKQPGPQALEPAITSDEFDGAALLGLNRAQRMDSEIILQNIILRGIPPPANPVRPPIFRV